MTVVNDDLCWTPATTLAAMIRTKKVSPVEVIDATPTISETRAPCTMRE